VCSVNCWSLHRYQNRALDILFIAKPQDSPAISFRRACAWRRIEVHHRFPFGGDSGARFPAGISFLIQSLRDRRGPADIAQLKHFDFKIAAFRPDLQHVANVNIPPGFDRLAFALNPSQITRVCGNAARLEEPRRPQPFVQTDTRHVLMLAVHEFSTTWNF
jgi:hypothetical protein